MTNLLTCLPSQGDDNHHTPDIKPEDDRIIYFGKPFGIIIRCARVKIAIIHKGSWSKDVSPYKGLAVYGAIQLCIRMQTPRSANKDGHHQLKIPKVTFPLIDFS